MKFIIHTRRNTLDIAPVRGVALVAVLAVLTVLAVMAAYYVSLMQMEQAISRTYKAKLQSDLLVQSAMEHAFSLLRYDAETTGGWDSPDEPWSQVSAGASPDGWYYVRDGSGRVIGRYKLNITDETGKININTAAALDPSMQNEGVGTFEVLLYGPDNRGLPIPLTVAKNILRFRYGRDMKPGQGDVDDNLTESLFALDEIDNNGNNIIDEQNEGIDEPQEYDSCNPKWDDRAFNSLHDALQECSGEKTFSKTALRKLREYATTFSKTHDLYYDTRSGKLRKRVNINVADHRQIRKVLRRGNQENPFESSSRNLRQLAANMMDYRDENHVLTTVGSEYGVEAICFNEILANDGGYTHETDWSGWGIEGSGRDDDHVFCNNYFYGRKWGSTTSRRYLWMLGDVNPVGGGARIKLDEPQRTFPRLDKFLKCEEQGGGWPQNLWKNSVVEIAIPRGEKREFLVSSSPATRQRELVIKASEADKAWLLTNKNNELTVRIANHWAHGPTMFNGFPEETERWWFPVPKDGREDFYFRAYVMGQVFEPNGWWGNGSNMKTLMEELDVDGIPAKYSVTDKIKQKYVYKNGKAVKANRAGYIEIVTTTSKRCKGREGYYPANYFNATESNDKNINWQYANYNNAVIFIRPDIVELINISDQPICMNNWRVVVNTGAQANELAFIDTASHYDIQRGGRYDNPSPKILPNGYFYLTNNREIFDYEYGDGSGVYGSSRNEAVPIFELPEGNWGIEYEVSDVNGANITVEGAEWETDQLEGELVEYLSDRKETTRNPPNGEVKVIYGNTRNTLSAEDPEGYGLRSGDRVRIMGLPREGGFVSFALKDEYDQITARTTEYGAVEKDEYRYSTEKFDPTHYTWVKNSNPTISGNEKEAVNRRMKTTAATEAHVKNNHFTSIGEIQKVRKASDWENIGLQQGGKASVNILKAIGDYFTTSGHRLDAEEEGANKKGWSPAFGVVRSARNGVLAAMDAQWEPGVWKGQTLRITSGKLSGEEFAIKDNTANGIATEGYSIPGGYNLRVLRGDTFSLGPGYASSMYYTRHDRDEGEWEWENKGLEKSSYGLYLFGLNDSINTTEFLEENHNAELEVSVFNYDTHKYEKMPLPRMTSGSSDDPYNRSRGSQKFQIDKHDGVYCGVIGPEHVSNKGGIKVKMSPSNLQNEKSSGIAWFDYVYLTPGIVHGKININTASTQVLSGLKGIDAPRAFAINRGVDNKGQRGLKPYRKITDILDVKGIDPNLFKDIANLITTRSDQFSVAIYAETISDVDADTTFSEQSGYEVLSFSDLNVVVDRSLLTDDNPDTDGFSYSLQH